MYTQTWKVVWLRFHLIIIVHLEAYGSFRLHDFQSSQVAALFTLHDYLGQHSVAAVFTLDDGSATEGFTLHDFRKIADRLCLARCTQTTFHNKHAWDMKRKQRATPHVQDRSSHVRLFFSTRLWYSWWNRHECSCQISTNFSSIYCVQIDREEAFFVETMPYHVDMWSITPPRTPCCSVSCSLTGCRWSPM